MDEFLRRLPPALLAVILLASCAPPAADERAGPLEFTSRGFERVIPGCGDLEKTPHPCVTFRVSWPEVTAAPSPRARERINGAILAALRAGYWEAEAQLLQDAFSEFQDRKYDNETAFYLRLAAGVVRNSRAILSISITEDRFTGEEPPEFRQTYLNFDPATGAEVRLSALLERGAEGSLSRYAANPETTPFAPAPEGLYLVPGPRRPPLLLPWSQAAPLFPRRSPIVPAAAR
jgi:hypothetical protein